MTMQEHISTNLKALRENRLMTQEDLAAAAGVSVSTVQRLEAGGNAQMESLKSICAVLETSYEELRRRPGGEEVDREASLPPEFDPAHDNLVPLDPVRVAKFIGEILGDTSAFYFVETTEMSAVQRAVAQQVLKPLRELAEMSSMNRYGCMDRLLLDIQDGMNSLRAAGLVLAGGRTTQAVQFRPVDGEERDLWFPHRTLVATVLPLGSSGHVAAIPRRVNWKRERVQSESM